MMDWGWTDGMHVGPMIVILSALTIALVVALVLAINALYPSAGRGDRRPADPPDGPRTAADAELELRYARGEIDAETLARQRAVLRQR